MSTQLKVSSTQRSAVVGVAGGLLVVAAVTVVSVTVPVAVLMLKRKRKKKNDFYIRKGRTYFLEYMHWQLRIRIRFVDTSNVNGEEVTKSTAY